mgnify:CR=1 FL=1
MSMPFGGHPTFGEYIAWTKSQKCEISFGVAYDSDGTMHKITKIVAPSGRWVIEVGTDQTDFLVPATIWHFDRRLGIASPFFSLPGKDLN